MTIVINGELRILTNYAKNQFINGEVCPVLGSYVFYPSGIAYAYLT